MANVSYIRILNVIGAFASEHLQIKKFGSDFPGQLPNFGNKNEEYPILFVSPSTSIFNTNAKSFDLNIYCFDLIQDDRENINTILSDTNSILNDLVLWLQHSDVDGIDLIDSSIAVPINNSLLDYAAGWQMTIKLEVNSYAMCEIPFLNFPSITGCSTSITFPTYLTCEGLEECPIIIEILDDIAALSGSTNFDIYVTGGTYNNLTGDATFTNNSGQTFSVTGFSTSTGGVDVFVTGGTYNNLTGTATYTNNTGGTFSVSGFSQSSGVDVFVTGGTYNQSNGIATYTNNTGGTFTVSGFSQSVAFDKFVTGGTYNQGNGTATFTNNSGQTFNVSGFSQVYFDKFVTGGTYNTSNGIATYTNNSGQTFSVSGFSQVYFDKFVTGGTYNQGNGIVTYTNNSGQTFTVSGFSQVYFDKVVTGGTYNNLTGTATFRNNSGQTFNVTGFTTGFTYTPENVANKQNSMAYDGTGIKYPNVDAVNNQANLIARAVVNTGFLDVNDPFTLYVVNDTTLGISGSSYGIAFSQRFDTPPFAPSEGIVNLTSRTVPLSNIGLTADTNVIKFVGYRASDDSILFSDTNFIQSPSVCQLGIVLVKYSGGTTTFIDFNRNLVTQPDIAAYSNLETTGLGLQSNVVVANNGNDLKIKNSAGNLIGISTNWHGANNDLLPIIASEPSGTTFTYIYVGNSITATPPLTSTLIDPTVYWNGSALVSTGDANSASVQKIMLSINGKVIVQYSEFTYPTFADAANKAYTQTFTELLPLGTAIEIGRLVVTNGATDLSDSTKAQFLTSGGGGGAGNSSLVTWGEIIGSINDQTDLQAQFATTLHKTGNESFTGVKSSTISGGVVFSLNNNGFGEAIDVFNNNDGIGYYVNNANNGRGLLVDNLQVGIGVLINQIGSNVGGFGVGVDNTLDNLNKLYNGNYDGANVYFVNYSGDVFAQKFIKEGGLSTEFLKADGSIDSTVYANDANVLHTTGDESFTGLKSSIITSGGAFYLENNGTGDAIDIYNQGGGVGLYSYSPNGGYGIWVDNFGSNTGLGIYVSQNGSDPSAYGIGVDNVLGTEKKMYNGKYAGNDVFVVSYSGDVTGQKFIKDGGLVTQYLMADGSVSTGADIIGFVAKTGDTMTGTLNIISSTTGLSIDNTNFTKTGIFIDNKYGANANGLVISNEANTNGLGIFINSTNSSNAKNIKIYDDGSFNTLIDLEKGVSNTAGTMLKLTYTEGFGSVTGITTSNNSVSYLPFNLLYNGVEKLRINYSGDVTAQKFIKQGGLSTEFLMADGSVSLGGGGSSLPSFTDDGIGTQVTSTSNFYFASGSNRTIKVNALSGDANNLTIAAGDSLGTTGVTGTTTVQTDTFTSFQAGIGSIRGMGSGYDGSVYVCGTNPLGVWRLLNGAGAFVKLPGNPGTMNGEYCDAAPNGDIYVAGTAIYKSTDGGVTFNSPVAGSFTGVHCMPNGDIYASRTNGDIWKSTNNGANWSPLGQTFRAWRDITSLNNNVYAVTTGAGGDIYMQTNATGAFVALGAGTKDWHSITSNGKDVYAGAYGAGSGTYKQTNGVGPFVLVSNVGAYGMAHNTISGDLFASDASGDVFRSPVQLVNQYGKLNNSGGTLVLESGLAVGTTSTGIEFKTSTPSSISGGTQTKSTKLKILGNGTLSFTTGSSKTLNVEPIYSGNGQSLIVSGGVMVDGNVSFTQANVFASTATGLGNLRGMGSSYNGDVYVTGVAMGIKRLVNGGSSWALLAGSSTLLNYEYVDAAPNGYIYATTGSAILRSTDNGNTFTTVFSIANLYGVHCMPNGDIYCSVLGGDIYKSTDNGTTFNGIGGVTRDWIDMSSLNNNIYAVTNNGDIYMQTNATGAFVALGQTSRAWRGITRFQNDMYACADAGGEIYKQTNGVGNFVGIGAGVKAWYGMATNHLTGDLYASVVSENVYKSLGTKIFQGAGGTLKLTGGDTVDNFTTSGNSITLTVVDALTRVNFGSTIAPNGDVYANVVNGDIYKQTGGIGSFVAQGQTARQWRGMVSNTNGDIYCCVLGGDIYKQTGGVGAFVGLGQTSRDWYHICINSVNGDIYATVYGGDIYKQTGGVGAFVALGQTVRNWTGIAELNGNIYAIVHSNDLYVQTGGVGNFVLAGAGLTVHNWQSICAIGNDLYISNDSNSDTGDIWKRTNNTGAFVKTNQVARNYYSIASRNYKLVTAGQNFIATSPAALFSQNYSGGSVSIETGTGAGSGSTSIDFVTATPVANAGGIQTKSTKMKILGNGNIQMFNVPIFASNAAALAGGLTIGTLYKTAGGVLNIVV